MMSVVIRSRRNGAAMARPKTRPAGTEPARFREQLSEIIGGESAYRNFKQLLAGIPPEARGKRVRQLPYSAWELLEHLRIAQEDILEYTREPNHESPAWPDGYWPKTPEPPSSAAWQKSVKKFASDLQAMQNFVEDPATRLFKPLAPGIEHTVAREAMLLAQHNAYHLGQLAVLKRLFGLM